MVLGPQPQTGRALLRDAWDRHATTCSMFSRLLSLVGIGSSAAFAEDLESHA